MDYNAIMQAVSTVGFPIVCCGVLFYQNSKLTETIGQLKDTLTKNTTILELISREINKGGN
jgi:hypothetical protein